MRPEEANYVLSVCAAYDSRPPSQATATAWAYDLAEVTLDEAVAAVREHYREHPDTWIKPGHVLALVKTRRRLGLANVSRVEEAALAQIDPDDPDYTAKAQRALANARQAAATDQAAIPAHREITSSREERLARNTRGKARAAAAMRPNPYKTAAAEVDERRQRLLDAAAEHRARKHSGDPETLGRPLGQAVTELRKRANQ